MWARNFRQKSRLPAHGICFLTKAMQTLSPLHSAKTISVKKQSSVAPDGGATVASPEIHSYLAARDLLLREADANPTEANLRRASAANEFAESCLRPARSPYQAQALPEAEAARERLRCNSVKVRLAQLRIRAGLRRRAA
jgi:hypothetical protein